MNISVTLSNASDLGDITRDQYAAAVAQHYRAQYSDVVDVAVEWSVGRDRIETDAGDLDDRTIALSDRLSDDLGNAFILAIMNANG
jgi:hypothetical protein